MDKPGVYRGLSYDEYAASSGIRKSTLWPLVTDTPADYKYQLENPEPETPAMKFGSAFHTYVLERERFGDEYAIGGPVNPRTGKAYGPTSKAFLEWQEETGLEAVSEEDMESIRGMAEEVFKHDEASEMLKIAETEVSILWEDETLGPLLQGRLDLWIESACLFADLKTAKSAHPKAFAWDSRKYGYAAQGALYFDGVKALTGREPYKPQFIVIEKSPPFKVAIYEIEVPDLEFGRAQYQGALIKLSACELEDHWPAYPGIQRLEVLE